MRDELPAIRDLLVGILLDARTRPGAEVLRGWFRSYLELKDDALRECLMNDSLSALYYGVEALPKGAYGDPCVLCGSQAKKTHVSSCKYGQWIRGEYKT
jgi:hypothetical protein